MKLERISYKSITVTLLVAVTLLSISHTLIAKRQFRDAAIRAQRTSLTQVIKVASDETLKNLRNNVYGIASSLQTRMVDPANHRLRTATALQQELDDIKANGFAGARLIDLAMLRIYNKEMQLIAEGNLNGSANYMAIPAFLMEQSTARHGVEQLKAIGGLWLSADGPRYSLLVPIGGLHLAGYLELVVDPAYNLATVSEMIKLPLVITTMAGKELFASADLPRNNEKFLSVEYLLSNDTHQPLYRLTAYEDISDFYDELHATQLKATVIFVSATLIVLILVLLLLHRYLFRPINKLMADVEHCIEGDLDTTLEEHGVKEVHIIAHAFNIMTRTIRDNLSELQSLSAVDGLTGIANRRVFDSRLEQEWARAIRHQTPLALLMIDIDYFKRYNDTLGHPAGDQCLREVALLLKQELKRPTDLIARYGGEEFVVLLPEADIMQANLVAVKMRNALQQHAIAHPASEISPVVTLSIGINTAIPSRGGFPHSLIEGADKALYQVKKSGRNNIGFAATPSDAISIGALQ